jgi:hypothetical protein
MSLGLLLSVLALVLRARAPAAAPPRRGRAPRPLRAPSRQTNETNKRNKQTKHRETGRAARALFALLLFGTLRSHLFTRTTGPYRTRVHYAYVVPYRSSCSGRTNSFSSRTNLGHRTTTRSVLRSWARILA